MFGRMASVSMSCSHPAREAQCIERIVPQGMRKGEVFPDHLKVGRLSLHGNGGEPKDRVSDGVDRVHAAAKASISPMPPIPPKPIISSGTQASLLACESGFRLPVAGGMLLRSGSCASGGPVITGDG